MIEEVRKEYLDLCNNQLPKAYPNLNLENHCYMRIVLDYLYEDKWDRVNPKKSAYKQLTQTQLEVCIIRMKLWLKQEWILHRDNNCSLEYRRK